MHSTAGGSLHRLVHNSNKSTALFRWEVEQRGAAGRGKKWRVNSAAEITWLTWQHTLVSALIPTNSPDNFVSVFYVCHCFRCMRFLFVFFSSSVCRVLEASLTPPLACGEDRGDPLLCSHIHFSWISTDLILLEARWRKSEETVEHLSRTFEFTHAPPPEKYGGTACHFSVYVWNQFMCERTCPTQSLRTFSDWSPGRGSAESPEEPKWICWWCL